VKLIAGDYVLDRGGSVKKSIFLRVLRGVMQSPGSVRRRALLVKRGGVGRGGFLQGRAIDCDEGNQHILTYPEGGTPTRFPQWPVRL